MLKQKLKTSWLQRQRFGAFLAAILLLSVTVFGGFGLADKYDQQIKELQKKNAAKQVSVDYFTDQATSYKDAVNRLQREIDRLQSTIDKAQNQVDKLKVQIAEKQQELDHKKVLLGQSIRTSYQEGKVSTLEILASSNNLSDFVNKQQYRSAVESKVKDTFEQILTIKTSLEQKQSQLTSLIQDTKSQQQAKGLAQAKQQQLLSYSASQRDHFQASINKNNSKISSLMAAQAAANAGHFGSTIAGDPSHGGYPSKWDNLPQDYTSDDWGMYNRECVSYTAWKVYQTFGYMPYWGGHGNANQWPGNARAAGIATGSTPRVHSVAIWYTASALGHAMWVDAVYGNGYIHVSQYNYDGNGHYSEMTIPSSGLTYIYFK